MFQPFLVRPSSGWNTIVGGTILQYNTIQYNIMKSVSVNGGDEISFTKIWGCVVFRYKYRLVTYSVTGSDLLALSGPKGLAVLEVVRGWGC
jgi:hypothetical protein